MIRIALISADLVNAQWLEAFRQYASIPSPGQDSMLSGLLTRAAFVVQEYADTSVLACSFRLSVDSVEDRRVRLYQTVAEVLSVKDATGEDVPYTQEGRTVVLGNDAPAVSVEYRTVPDLGEQERLLPVVLRYATALYDGQDNAELTKIVQEVC